MNKSVLILFTLLVFVQLKCTFGARPKFAPKYCLRFKFDCKSPEKKGHVCCLFPLPVEGNGVGDAAQYAGMTTMETFLNINKIRNLF